MSVLNHSLRDQARHHAKRVRAALHGREITVAVDGTEASIETPTAMATENMRWNLQSEREITRVILAAVPGRLYLDVGAGWGCEAVLAARAGADRVIAIEAHPARARWVKINALRNGVGDIVDVHCVRVGNADGQRLDEMDLDPDVIKMDIEGAEWDALRGGRETTAAAEAVFVEAHPEMLPDDVTVGGDLVSLFDSSKLDVAVRSVRDQLYLVCLRENGHETGQR